jgi:molybdopterin/thiamine biosynthesis adenylyltransferase
VDRYARHLVLPWFGKVGQEKLRAASVLVVGCGGTGCACTAFLARAGIGRIRIVDPDVVSLTDLHRQILFDETDASGARPKAHVAAERLGRGSESNIEAVVTMLNRKTARTLTAGVDLVVDCTDNFEARMLINDVSIKHELPWVHGACVSTMGLVIPFPGAGGACYRCVVDHIPSPKSAPRCDEIGILGPVAGLVGSIEAAEAIRMLVIPEDVEQRIIYIDTISYTYETIAVTRKVGCPACGSRNLEFLGTDEP